MSRLTGIALLLVAGEIVGAGEGSPYELAIRRMLGALDNITKTLRTIETEEAATAAVPELRKAVKNWVEARARADKMQPPERAEKDRLAKIYKPKIDESLKKMFTEIARVEVVPGSKEVLKEIRPVLKKDGK